MTITAQDAAWRELFRKALATDAEFAKFRACRTCHDHTEHEHVRVDKREIWRCKHCKTEWQR